LLKFGLQIFVGHRSLAFVTIEHGRTGLAKGSSLLSFLIVAANALPEVIRGTDQRGHGHHGAII
jgi:hypothetical protein